MTNLFNVKDKVAVITGGCGILGRGMAEYMCQQGVKVVVLDRDAAAGEKLIGDLTSKGHDVLFLYTDVIGSCVEENIYERHLKRLFNL